MQSSSLTEFTPDQRRRAVAAILAQGVLRYRRVAKLALQAVNPDSSPQCEKGLDLPAETRLSVANGAGG